jgi:hypothetical protein
MAEVIRPTWMTNQMYDEWLNFYLEAGGDAVPNASERATQMFRASPNYESYFPGIKREEDGSIRYGVNPEQTYFENINAYRNTVEGLGLNPDVFGPEYIDLIMGDTSPSEFTSRANALEDRVMSQSESIRAYYTDLYGLSMTRESILASLMSNRVEQAVFERQLTMAEIGGEAAQRNYDLTGNFVEILAQSGMDRGEAQRLFGTAEAMLPALAAMAARHADPDDTFDITEFAQGAALQDPEQVARIRRLQAQEAASFTGGATTDIQRSERTGGVVGLDTR